MNVISNIGSGITGAMRYDVSEGKDAETGEYKPPPLPGEPSRAEVLDGFNLGLTLDDARRLGVSDDPLKPDIPDAGYVEFARKLMEQNGRPDFQGAKNYYCAKDCLHFNLNWAPGENPTREQKIAAARDYLAFQGMDDAMALIIDHKDHPHRHHIHGVASRMRPKDSAEGKAGHAYPDRERGLRDKGWAVQYEEEQNRTLNWPIPKGSQWRHDERAITREAPDYEAMREKLFDKKSVVTTYRADLALAFGGHFGRDADYHRARFAEGLLPLASYPNGKTSAYTTQKIYAQEGRIMGLAKKLHAQTGFEVPDAVLDEIAKKYNADEEQKASARHLTRDNGFAVQTGDAGTGKSYVTNKIVRECYERLGRGVGGGGFTNNVALLMRQDGLENAHTLDHWKLRLEREKPGTPPLLKTGDVFVYDEAGQVKNDHFEPLNRELLKRGVKVILSGDPKQMQSVEQGSMMDVHIRQFGTSRLTKVYRNLEKEQDWKNMAEGVEAQRPVKKQAKWEKAIDGFKARNEIHWFDTQDEAIQGIAEQYEKDRKEHPDQTQLILGHTNEEVKLLNEAVIKLQTERGPETIVETSRGPIGYAVGDRVMLKDNHPDLKEKRKGFANGRIGNLIGLETEKDGRPRMTLDMDQPKGAQRRVFSFIAGLDRAGGEFDTYRGIAGTTYTGQGKSIDRVYPLHNPAANANGQYVGMTRDKKQVFLAVARDETGGYPGLIAQMSSGGGKRAAHTYFLQRDEKRNTIEPERNTTQERKVASLYAMDKSNLPMPNGDNMSEYLADITPFPQPRLLGVSAMTQEQEDRALAKLIRDIAADARREPSYIQSNDDLDLHKHAYPKQSYSKQDRDEFTAQAAGKNIDEMREDQPEERARVAKILDRLDERDAMNEEAEHHYDMEDQNKSIEQWRERSPEPSPEETLRKFGYPEETIGNLAAETKRVTAKMLDDTYPDGPPDFREDPAVKNRAVQDLFKAHRKEEGLLNKVFNAPTPMQQHRMADEIDRLPEEKYVPAWKAARQLDEIAKEKLAKEWENLTPKQKKEREALTPEQKQANQDRNIKEFGEEWRRLAKEEREGRAPAPEAPPRDRGISSWADLRPEKEQSSVLDIADKRSWGFKLKEEVINKWFGKTEQKDKTAGTGHDPKNAIGKEIQDKTTATGYVRKNGEVEKGDLKDKTKATEPGLLPSTEKNSPWLSKLDTVTSAIDRAFRPEKKVESERSEGTGQGLQRPSSGYGL